MLDTCVGMDRERELKDNDEAPKVEVGVAEVAGAVAECVTATSLALL